MEGFFIPLLIFGFLLIPVGSCVSFENVKNVSTSQQLLDVLQNLTDTTLVKIFPGNYTLNTTVDLVKLQNITLQGAGKNFGDVLIVCQKDVGLSISFSEDITIEKISFLFCGTLRNSTSSYYIEGQNRKAFLLFHVGILFVYSRNIFIIDTQISNSPGIGLTLYDVNGKVNFTSVVIRNNTVKIHSVNGTLANVGGGVYVEFTNSHAPPPFGYHDDPYHSRYTSDSIYTISHSSFTENHANWSQGKQDIDYPGENETHMAFGRGGGFSVFVTGNASRNTLLINNCSFKNNLALWGAGVFAELHDTADRNVITLTDNLFEKNSAVTGGGGARMGSLVPDRQNYSGNHFLISGCDFLDNTALIGGGLSIFGQENHRKQPKDPWIEIKDCNLTGNNGTLGAALSFACSDSVFGSPYTIELNNCSISRNQAISRDNTIGQGAVWSYAVQLAFRGYVRFIENINTALLLEVRSSVVVYDKVLFRKNSGFKGGAAALFGDSFFQLMKDSKISFLENICTEKGGAIYVHWNGPPIISLYSTEVATHGCFFRYLNDSVDQRINPDHWETRVEFINNTALGKNASGDAVFADTLQGCLKAGQNFSKVLEWDTFKYDNRCLKQIITNPVSMTFSRNNWMVTPGEIFNPSLMVYDEKNNSIYSIIEVTITGEVSLETPSNYFLVSGFLERLKLSGAEDSNFTVKLTTTGGQIVQKQFSATLNKCNSGFVYDKELKSCKCDSSQVSNCEGQKVFIKDGYWAGKNIKDQFVVYPCPEGYCKCNKDPGAFEEECLYVEGKMCTDHRKGVLCGSCADNYSALIGITDCGEDTRHSSWNALLILVFFAGMFFFVYLVLLINLDIFTGYLNAWLYSYQVINVILKEGIHSKADPFIKFIIGVAHLELEIGKGQGIYQYKGMTSLHKLGYHYFVPVSILLVLFIMVKMSRTWPHSFLFRRLNVASPYRAFCTLFVLVYSSFTQTSLEILDFAALKDSYVLFKDGDIVFLQDEHIAFFLIALLFISIIVIPVPMMLMFRRKFTAWSSCFTNPVIISILDTFKCCFKDDQAWFAGFYFVGRFFLLLWATFLPFGEIKDLFLQISCLIVLLIFLNCWPYRDNFNWINKVDFVLLVNLCVISQLSGSIVSTGQDKQCLTQKALINITLALLYLPLFYALGMVVYWLHRRFCPGFCFQVKEVEVRDEFPSSLAENALRQPLLT